MFTAKQFIQSKLLIQLSFAFLIGTIASTPAVCQQPPTPPDKILKEFTITNNQAHFDILRQDYTKNPQEPGSNKYGPKKMLELEKHYSRTKGLLTNITTEQQKPTQKEKTSQDQPAILNPIIAQLIQATRDGTITKKKIVDLTKTKLEPIINTQDSEGKTLAHYLALFHEPEFLYWLLGEYNYKGKNLRINITIEDNNGYTPFDYLENINKITLRHTLDHGTPEMLKRLIERGYAPLENDNQAIIWALDKPKRHEILEILLNSITNPETKKTIINQIDNNRTPLHMAAKNNDTLSVELLLKCGADPKISTSWGTPLHSTALSSDGFNIKIAEALIKSINPQERLEYINMKDTAGRTPKECNMYHAKNEQSPRAQAFDDLIKRLTTPLLSQATLSCENQTPSLTSTVTTTSSLQPSPKPTSGSNSLAPEPKDSATLKQNQRSYDCKFAEILLQFGQPCQVQPNPIAPSTQLNSTSAPSGKSAIYAKTVIKRSQEQEEKSGDTKRRRYD